MRRQAALRLTLARDWSAAARAWQQLAAEAPAAFEPALRLAEALCFLGRTDEAIAAARVAATARGDDARPLVLLARAHAARGEDAPAREAWQAAVERAPDCHEAWARLATIHFGNGEIGPGFAALHRVLALVAGHPYVIAVAARALLCLDRSAQAGWLAATLDAGTRSDAIAILRAMLEASPESRTLRLELAIRLLAAAQAPEALGILQALVADDPAGAGSHRWYARALHRARRWAEAEMAWRALLENGETGREAPFRLAQALRMQGHRAVALPYYELAIRQACGDPAILEDYTRCLVDLGRGEDAVPAWQAALAVRPNDAALRRAWGTALLTLGRGFADCPGFDPMLVDQPGYDGVALLLLRTLQAEGDQDAIIARFAPLITSMPPDGNDPVAAEILVHYTAALAAAGRSPEAVETLLAALRQAPGSSMVLRAVLRTLFDCGDHAAGVAVARQAVMAYPDATSPWRDTIAILCESAQAGHAAALFAEASARFAQRPADWLEVAEAATRGGLAEPVRAGLETLQFTAAPDRIGASDLAFRLGALGRALELLTEDVVPAGRLARIERIERVRGLLGGRADAEIVFPNALYGLLCARAAGLPLRSEWAGGPIVLVNSALAAGGAERQIALTLQGLAARKPGRELHLVCTRLTDDPRRRVHLAAIRTAGVHVTDLQQLAGEMTEPEGLDDTSRFLLDLLGADLAGDALRLLAVFRRLQPACVHLWQDGTAIDGGIAAALAGVPRIVLSTRSTRPLTRQRLQPHMHAAYTALLGLAQVRLVNNSEAGARDYEDWLGLAPGRITVIHNGFDFRRFDDGSATARAAALRTAHGLPDGVPVVGGVFRMTDVKRPLLWVEVAGRIARQRPDVHFVIAGGGPLAGQVAAAADRLGFADRLILPGYVDIVPWLRVMDLMLLTSRTEGLPNVLIEAQALGIPVVATRVGGVAEAMLEGRTGHAVADDDPDRLAAAVLAALDDPDWMAQARQVARAFVHARFSLEPMLDRTLGLYGITAPVPAARFPPPRETARAHARQGAWQDAAAVWQRLLEVAPDDAEARLGAGEAAFMLQRLDEAQRHFSMVADERRSLEARRWLARVARAEKNHEKAVGLWQELLAGLPGDLEALLRCAEELAALGDEAGALAAAERGVAEHPADRRLLRVRARLKLQAGALGEALAEWEALAAADPGDGEALFRAGQTALRLGEGRRAEAHLQGAVALDRPDSRAVTALARHFGWTGRQADARRVLRRHWRMRPDNPDIVRAVFDGLRTAERTGVIDRFLARAARRAGQDDAARLHLAELMVAAERPLTARRVLEALNPAGAHGVAAAGRLADLALRAGDMHALRAVAGRCAAPALCEEVAAVLTWTARLEAETGQPDVQAGFLAWLAAAADRRGRPDYEPRHGSVLHVVNSLAMGGSERQCLNLVRAQSASMPGQITVLRTDPGRAGRAAFFLPDLAEAGVASATLEDFAAPARALRAELPELARPQGRLGEALMPRQAVMLAGAIRALRPAAVMVWSPQCMADTALAALLTGVPRLVLRSGSVALPVRATTTETEALRYSQWREVLRCVLQRPSGWLLNNCQANLATWLHWLSLDAAVPGERCGVLPNLVEPAALTPATWAQAAALRSRLGIPDGVAVIGGVMRLEQEKGVFLWLAVARALLAKRDDAVFVIVGGGRLEEALRRDAAAAGIAHAVRFAGTVDEELAACYALFDVLLLTSVVEGVPNVVIEAQCFGVPVVASDVGGVSEAVAPGLGHELIAGRAPQPYADALLRALRVATPRQWRIAHGRRFVAGRFGRAAVLARLHRVLGGAA